MVKLLSCVMKCSGYCIVHVTSSCVEASYAQSLPRGPMATVALAPGSGSVEISQGQPEDCVGPFCSCGSEECCLSAHMLVSWLSRQLSVFQSSRPVLKWFYFLYKWEQQIVAKFSTVKWVSVGCSWCLKAGKRASRCGWSESAEDLCHQDSSLPLLLTPLPMFLVAWTQRLRVRESRTYSAYQS